MTARVSAFAIDVLRAGTPKARVSAVAVDVLAAQGPAEEVVVDAAGVSVAHDETGPLDLVLTQVGAEAVIGGTATPLLTQHGVEAIVGGTAKPEITQLGVEVLYRVFPGCADAKVAYRVRIRNAADSADQMVFTSLAEGDNAVIVKEPQIDAARVDLLTGKTDVGACVVEIADATPDDCDSANDGTVRQFTQYLADDAGRLDLIGRRVLVEASDDDGDTWAAYWGGFLAGIRYPDAITVALDLASTTREDETRQVWAGYTETFPNAGVLLGGPVINGVPSAWPSVRVANNEGKWVGEVIGVYPTHIDMDIDEDASGAFPPSDIAPFLKDRGFIRFSNNDAQRNVFAWAERNAQHYFARDPRFVDSNDRQGWYPRVDVDVVIKNGVAFSATFPMVAAKGKLPSTNPSAKVNYATLFNGNLGNGFAMAWPDDAAIAQPIVGDVLEFYARPKDTSEACPLWVTGHPVDILIDLWDEAGIPHNGGGSVKTALGTNEVALRITRPMSLSEAQQLLCGAFGFGWRTAPNGVRSLFTTRVRPAVVATITINDLVSADGIVWEVDERSRLFAISYKWKRFETWPAFEDPASAPRALDGVVAYDEAPIIFRSLDDEPYGARTQEYDVPGLVLDGAGLPVPSVDATAILAEARLASFADGMVETTIDVRPTVTVLEGDDVMLDLPHRPGVDIAETPVAQRGLPERCQCISRTVFPWGQRLTLVRVVDVGDPLSNDGVDDPEFEPEDPDPLEGQSSGSGLQTPTVTFSVDGSWNVSAAVEGGPDAVEAYCLGSTSAFPSVAALLAATPDTSVPFEFANVVSGLAAGATAYIAAVTKDADGNVSLRGVAQYTRPAAGGGGGSVTHPYAVPVAADFTTANGLTLTDRAQTMGMSATGTLSGSDPVPRAHKAKPGGPTWDIATHFRISTPSKNFYGAGLMLRDSATGNHYQFNFNNNTYHSPGPTITLMKNSNDQIYNGFGGEILVIPCLHNGPTWLRIRDDATNLYFEVSGAAGEWVSVFSEARTTHLAGGGDQVGLVLWPWAESGTVYAGKVDVLHFGPTPTYILPY